MKIVKRDGRIVEYDAEKIRLAISKANADVAEESQVTEKQIQSIIKYIEGLKKKRMLVEDIQDIIEEKLMSLGKHELAKAYIIYRYTRALVRKSNTTDELILSLIRNNNNGEALSKANHIASTQRDLIAGEVSKDLTKRILLPEKISKAHTEGVIYFHDSEYFLQPIFNTSVINIKDMLDNGTVINSKLMETPNSFQVACTVMTQIIAAVASGQYGGQALEVKHLGKYLRKSYDKHKKKLEEKYTEVLDKEQIESIARDRVKEELAAGVQTIQYQINTLITTHGKCPLVTLFLNIEKDDEYEKENAMIIEEILKQRLEGTKNENGEYVSPEAPILVYVLNETNNLNGGEYDYLTRLALECTKKRKYPTYISAKVMSKLHNGNVFSPMGNNGFLSDFKDENKNYIYEGRFNQGTVTLNLPQIGILAEGNEELFWNILNERLDICFEALMCRHHALLGTLSNISPVHFQYGGISRFEKGEKIDKLLKNGYSTISLGYIGIYETTKLIKGVSHTEPTGKAFALKVMQTLKDKCDKWTKDTGLAFVLYATPSSKIGTRFAKQDKEQFGAIKDITDKGYYTNAYHLDVKEKMDMLEKIKFEREFQNISNGGAITVVELNKDDNIDEKLEQVISCIYDNVQYAEINLIGNN